MGLMDKAELAKRLEKVRRRLRALRDNLWASPDDVSIRELGEIRREMGAIEIFAKALVERSSSKPRP